MKKLLLILLCFPMIGFGQDFGVALRGDGSNSWQTFLSYSEDGGLTWTYSEGGNSTIPFYTYESLFGLDIRAFSLVNSDTIIALGVNAICISYDRGVSYSCQQHFFPSLLTGFGTGSFTYVDAPSDDITFINSNVGFLFKESNVGAIYKTIDGGLNWFIVFQYSWPNSYTEYDDASFVNDSVFYLIDNFNKVYTTNNSGLTINLISDLTSFTTNGPHKNNGIFFTSELNGYVLLEVNKVIYTNDGGFTWSLIGQIPASNGGLPSSPIPQRELYFYNDTIGYFFNQQEVNGKLYKLINTSTPIWQTVLTVQDQPINHLKEFAFFEGQITSGLIINENYIRKKLIKVTDLLGREIKQTNQPLFYIYDDGTVEKRIVIE